MREERAGDRVRETETGRERERLEVTRHIYRREAGKIKQWELWTINESYKIINEVCRYTIVSM